MHADDGDDDEDGDDDDNSDTDTYADDVHEMPCGGARDVCTLRTRVQRA